MEAQKEIELQSILSPIRKELDAMSEYLVRELQSTSPRVEELITHLARYRGKRLRSALVLLSGKGFGNFTQTHIPVAAIVEMIHTATLVHDDILDEATIRRQLPTVRSRWGNDSAVLLGDYIYAKAFSISTRLESQLASRVLSEVTKTICQGEIEQIASRYDFELSEERYLQMIGAKTASLYASACELGAAYAGASETAVREMYRFGWNLGLAFQIIDDCLDLEGAEEVVGKSLGTDVCEGKLTLPILFVLRGLKRSERRRIEEIYRSAKVSDPVQALWKEFPIREGIDDSLAKADSYIRESLSALRSMPSGSCRNSMEFMAEYVLCRKW